MKNILNYYNGFFLTEKMEKWKVAQKKWAWHTTLDRNIGGHTARIPDSYTVHEGPGPKGIGVDLSSKELIDKLAETIIPRSKTSRRSKIHDQLEDRWRYHHGGGKYGVKTEVAASRPNSAPYNPVRSLFDRSQIKQENLQELISQLKLAVENPVVPEPEKKRGTRGGRDNMGARRRSSNNVHKGGPPKRTTRLWQRKVEQIMGNKARNPSEHYSEEEDGEEEARKKPNPRRRVSRQNSKQKRSRSDEKKTVSPDSGFHSDASSLFTKSLNPSANAALSSLLTPDAISDLLKQCSTQQQSSGGGAGEENVETDTNQTLLALLQEAQDLESSETNPLIKKAYQVTSVVTELRRDKFVLPITNNFDMPLMPKLGQSFTRRRTKGQMYTNLEPISYSDVYLKKSPSHPSLNKNKTLTTLPSFHKNS